MRIIEPLLVDGFDGHKKAGMGVLVDVINVADLRQIELVPVMGPFFTRVACVLVLDPVPEGVFGPREFPGEYMMRLEWVGIPYDGRIAPIRARIVGLGVP
jgi:hypothetical protein